MREDNIVLKSMKVFANKNTTNEDELKKYGYEYDLSMGGWVNKNGEYMMLIDDPKKPPRPSTKKEDIETGEDLKSE